MSEKFSLATERIDAYRLRIPRQGKMQTDGIMYTDESMLPNIQEEQSLMQVANVACLPGIVGNSLGHARYPLGLRLSHRRGRGL